MTRAAVLLLHGELMASFAMHPLLLPVAGAWAMIAATTITATARDGVPWYFWRTKFGRVAIAAIALVYVALVGLWALREAGHFGGPVPV